MQKRFKKAGNSLRIHRGCRIINIHKLEVGHHVQLGVDSYLQAGGGITLGDFTVMGPGVKIWSQTHEFEYPNKPLEYSGYNYDEVVIGNNVWICANAFIMPGTQIEEGCIISACSVVGKKVWPKNTIISGNPARKIGERGKFRKTGLNMTKYMENPLIAFELTAKQIKKCG